MRRFKYRFIIMILTGIIISFVINSVKSFDNADHNKFIDLFISIFITAVIWEGNLIIDEKLNIRYSWIEQTSKRLLIQLPIFVIYSTSVILIIMLTYEKLTCELPYEQEVALIKTCVVIGLLFSFVLLAIEIGAQFFGYWKQSLIQIEHHKTEVVQAQLQNLKNQINPHFLFNNMSVLSSLVYKDKDKAVDFINQLSKVYRYLLDSKDIELVSLEDEIKFIRSYIYLLQIRFDTNIQFKLLITPDSLNKLLPPMAIQILLENAIKHNEISEAQPLTIEIKTEGDILEVSNNLQLRTNHEPSSKTGLKNICDRYKYFTSKTIEIKQNEKIFSVKIPLLNSK